MLRQSAAYVFRAQNVPQNSVAVVHRFRIRQRRGIVEILAMVSARQGPEQRVQSALLAHVVLKALGQRRQQLAEHALGLFSTQAKLLGQCIHALAVVFLKQGLKQIHAPQNIMGTETRMQLLLVDDDAELAQMMREFLAPHDFELDVALDGTGGLAKALSGNHDLILLDGMLPGLDGLEVLRQVRRRSATPVIMLTARGAPADRIQGLDTGADDYLTKPFGPDELVARIRAVLRRSNATNATKPEQIIVGAMRIDPAQRQAFLRDENLALTSAQFEILEYLMRNAGRAVSRDELTAILHQRESTPFERWLDVHISQLRKKIEADGQDRIHTVRGVGYMFGA